MSMSFSRCSSWVVESIRAGGLPAIGLFLFHVVADRGFHAYEHWNELDVPMHLFGGLAIAWFFHHAALAASARGIIGPFHRVTHAVLVFALTCMATVFWEFAEFLTDLYLGTKAQLGVADTMGDMLLGICGGLAVLAFAWWRLPNGEPSQDRQASQS